VHSLLTRANSVDLNSFVTKVKVEDLLWSFEVEDWGCVYNALGP
jgi:hypothetical protein